MPQVNSDLHYSGPIFDAHSHVADQTALRLLVDIGTSYGVVKNVLIVHDRDISGLQHAYPGRFVFARFFMPWDMKDEELEKSISTLHKSLEEGYSIVKTHFAPFWPDRITDRQAPPPLDDDSYNRFFGVLADEQVPVLVHVADPDTYYATRYSDKTRYGTKDQHIDQLEHRLSKSSGVKFQVAHFGAQPEQDRLTTLSRMFEMHSNLYVDTGSARWMVRELGKNVERSRRFITKHSHRILFGSDCVARTDDRSYYEGRYQSERLLFETDVRGVPLPFTDNDTVNSGGTQINGLSLPSSTLTKIYWENANKLYCVDT